MESYIGFDSAWTDSSNAPGAICAVTLDRGQPVHFYEPKLSTFDQALDFIREVSSRSDYTLVALDQPTKVPNLTGMRPVEKLAASLVSWIGGGVQPSNRKKLGMFCDASPIWRFLRQFGAIEDPDQARHAVRGLYLIEVFPALALASLDTGFFKRLGHPKYNPANTKRFLQADWNRVCEAGAAEAGAHHCADLQRWFLRFRTIEGRRKADQDKLDAGLCLLTAIRWRLSPETCLYLGDLESGYMVIPASEGVCDYLIPRAEKLGVPASPGEEQIVKRFSATPEGVE